MTFNREQLAFVPVCVCV